MQYGSLEVYKIGNDRRLWKYVRSSTIINDRRRSSTIVDYIFELSTIRRRFVDDYKKLDVRWELKKYSIVDAHRRSGSTF